MRLSQTRTRLLHPSQRTIGDRVCTLPIEQDTVVFANQTMMTYLCTYFQPVLEIFESLKYGCKVESETVNSIAFFFFKSSPFFSLNSHQSV